MTEKWIRHLCQRRKMTKKTKPIGNNGKILSGMSGFILADESSKKRNQRQKNIDRPFAKAAFTVVINDELDVFVCAKTEIAGAVFDTRNYSLGLIKYALTELLTQTSNNKINMLMERNETNQTDA